MRHNSREYDRAYLKRLMQDPERYEKVKKHNRENYWKKKSGIILTRKTKVAKVKNKNEFISDVVREWTDNKK